MAGLTINGLEILRLPEIIEQHNIDAQTIFSDQVNPGDEVETHANSTLGRMIGLISPSEATIWEQLQQVNDSFNPNTATGIALDNIVSLSGIQRRTAAPSRAQVVIEGSIGTLLNSGVTISSSITGRLYSLVTPVQLIPDAASGIGFIINVAAANSVYTIRYSVDGIQWIDITVNSGAADTKTAIAKLLRDKVVSQAGDSFKTYVEGQTNFVVQKDPFQVLKFEVTPNITINKVQKLCVASDMQVGPYEQPAFSLDTIAVPIPGWDKVSNPVKATVGNFRETDEDLRERFRNSKFFQAANIIESLVDGLRNVTGVTDVMIYENDTDATNELGVPPHSFLTLVLGGINTEVAESIWENKPTGIPSVGTTTVQITDSQGLQHPISFKRPTQKFVKVVVNISNVDGLPGNAETTIRQNILDYARPGYLIGDDVIYSRFYTPVNAVGGHTVNSLTIGFTGGAQGTTNLPIGFDEVAVFLPENILVNIT